MCEGDRHIEAFLADYSDAVIDIFFDAADEDGYFDLSIVLCKIDKLTDEAL